MGGQVFKGTSPIKKERVEPTIDNFKEFLSWIFPEAVKYFEEIDTCGSTGKKDVSGDIDLILDENFIKALKYDEEEVNRYFEKFKKRARTSTDAMLKKRAILTWVVKEIDKRCEGMVIGVSDKGTSNGAIFFKFPQYIKSGATNDWVQIDVNVGNPDWLRFAYYSAGEEGNVKGLHRTQLLLHMFAHNGMVMSHNYGIKYKVDNSFVTDNPERALHILNLNYGIHMTFEDASTYRGIQSHLRTMDEKTRNEIYDIYLKTLDSTRCDIPEDLQTYWWENRRRLGLQGRFIPKTSALYPLVNF